MLKSKKLSNGNTIGIVAPAGPVYENNRIQLGIDVLQNIGYKIILGNSCSKKEGYLAGDDEIRANDINEFFHDENVDAIICLRGGYGSLRILDKINYSMIRKHPKPFIGYSDVTAIQSALFKKCSLITFHGPMLASDIAYDNPDALNSLIECLSGNIANKKLKLDPINKGNIEGRFIGGNLSVLCSILKTGYEYPWNDKVIFIEEVNEEPYKIDRMLHQLKLAKVLDKVSGVILGDFIDCCPSDKARSCTLDELLNEFFMKLHIPVYKGLPIGHGVKKITIPIGVKVKIDYNTLEFLEEGVY